MTDHAGSVPIGQRDVQSVETAPPGRVGIIAVTYQSADDLPGFLESLPAAVAPYEFELVAVDNASTDASVELVREFGAVVEVNAVNTGLSAAINQGAARTGAEWLLIVNPDTSLLPGSIARLVDVARSEPSAGCVGPRIEDLDGRSYPTGRRFPSVGVGIAHALLGGWWKSNLATRRYFGDSTGGPVDWISGSCMLFRRDAFDSVSGFDTRYFMYFEETDMCLRLHRAGWQVIYEPSVAIRHREGGSTRFAPFRKVVNHHRSALRFYCVYHRRDPWILLAPAVAAGLLARAGLAFARTAVGRRLADRRAG